MAESSTNRALKKVNNIIFPSKYFDIVFYADDAMLHVEPSPFLSSSSLSVVCFSKF